MFIMKQVFFLFIKSKTKRQVLSPINFLMNLQYHWSNLFSFYLANETYFVHTLKDCTPLGPNDTIVYDNSYTITSEVRRTLMISTEG